MNHIIKKKDNYNYDNESQYYYDPEPFILGVNNNTTPQEEYENMDNNIEALEEEENIKQPTSISYNSSGEKYSKLEDKATNNEETPNQQR